MGQQVTSLTTQRPSTCDWNPAFGKDYHFNYSRFHFHYCYHYYLYLLTSHLSPIAAVLNIRMWVFSSVFVACVRGQEREREREGEMIDKREIDSWKVVSFALCLFSAIDTNCRSSSK